MVGPTEKLGSWVTPSAVRRILMLILKGGRIKKLGHPKHNIKRTEWFVVVEAVHGRDEPRKQTKSNLSIGGADGAHPASHNCTPVVHQAKLIFKTMNAWAARQVT